MRRWYPEDWHFTIEVVRVGRENRAEECRLGLEPGDRFEFTFETPGGFCPTTFIKLFPVLEIVRCGGDLQNLGGSGPTETKLLCPDGVRSVPRRGRAEDGLAAGRPQLCRSGGSVLQYPGER